MSDPHAPSPTRRGRIIAVLIGLLVTVGLVVGAVIGIERVLAAKAEHELYEEPVSRRAIRLKEHNPGVDRLQRPSDAYLARSHNLPDIEYRFRTDAQGFIEPGLTSEDPRQRDLLIAFLGGSTTECLYVPEGSRFPAVVRELFRENDVRADVMNSGVSGNNVMHSINILANKILGQKPDYVVLMHAWNDLGYLMSYGDYWSVKDPLRSLIIEENTTPSGLDLKAVFKFYLPYTFNLVKRTWQQIGSDSGARSGGSAATPSRLGEVARARLAAQFESALTTFVSVARSWGVTPVLMTQAAFLPPRAEIVDRHKYLASMVRSNHYIYEDFVDMHGRFNDVIRQIGDKLDVPVIDLAGHLSAQEYIYDPVHLNEKGSRLAGEMIFNRLEQLYNAAKGHASADTTGALMDACPCRAYNG